MTQRVEDTLVEPPRTLHAKFVQNGDALHIRKWSVERPFDGAAFYVYAGRGDPLQPGDSPEHYPPEQLPMCLRYVAQCLPVECEQHVIEDNIRIVADSADRILSLESEVVRLREALAKRAERVDVAYRQGVKDAAAIADTHDSRGDTGKGIRSALLKRNRARQSLEAHHD